MGSVETREAPEYLTVKEVAALLRVKERKVYDLVSAGDIPCSRAMGKLLFNRQAVERWLSGHTTGEPSTPGADRAEPRPNVFLGSHDPLLDWALRESRCGLATFFDSSRDGLERFANREGLAAGLHIPNKGEGWNTDAVKKRFGSEPMVLVEWAKRLRGLIVPPGNEIRFPHFGSLAGNRVALRQAEAGSQLLLERLMREAGLPSDAIEPVGPALSETDSALMVADGKADAAFGLKAMARQYRLGFAPVIVERYDLLVCRRAWFEPPFQMLLELCREEMFVHRANEMEGYDVTRLGKVHFNGGS